jgi:hypothetical protein
MLFPKLYTQNSIVIHFLSFSLTAKGAGHYREKIIAVTAYNIKLRAKTCVTLLTSSG